MSAVSVTLVSPQCTYQIRIVQEGGEGCNELLDVHHLLLKVRDLITARNQCLQYQQHGAIPRGDNKEMMRQRDKERL